MIHGCMAWLMLTLSLASGFDAVDVPWPAWEKLASRGSEGLQHALMKNVSRQVFEKMSSSIMELKPGDVSVPCKIQGFDIDTECHHYIKAHESEARGNVTQLFFAGPQGVRRTGAGFDLEADVILQLNIKLVTMVTVTMGTHFEMFGSSNCTPRVRKDVGMNISYKGQSHQKLKLHFSEPRAQESPPRQGAAKALAFRLRPSLVGAAISWEMAGIDMESHGRRSCELLVWGRRAASACNYFESFLRDQIPALVENVVPVTEPKIIAELEEWLAEAVGKEPVFPVNIIPIPVIYV